MAQEHPNSAMEQLFQVLHHMRDNSSFSLGAKDAPADVLDWVIGMSRRLGEYDPSIPVGPDAQPLLHALNLSRDLSPEWLAYFATDHQNNLLFDRVDNHTIGSIIFKRMFAEKDLKENASFMWWVKNVPAIEPNEGALWLEKMSAVSPRNIYDAAQIGGSAKKHAQEFIAALMDRGVQLLEAEPGRPQERWSQKSVWWEKLRHDGRLEELVRSPSGRWRRMQDLMGMGGGSYSQGFRAWLEGEEKSLAAPHGRRKELLESWVLGMDASLDTAIRAQRLAAAIHKTEGVLDEMYVKSHAPAPNKRDFREEISQLLSYRAPSGMSLRTWFFLNEKDKTWTWPEPVPPSTPPSLGANMQVQDWVSPDGAGLVLQKLRAMLNDGEGEFVGRSDGCDLLSRFKQLSGHYQHAFAGDPQTHPEMVDLMVDALVAPEPRHAVQKIALGVLQHGLLADGLLASKLHQACNLSKLPGLIQAVGGKNGSGYETGNRLKAAHTALLSDIQSGAWFIPLSARDWKTILATWGVTPEAVRRLGPDHAEPLSRIMTGLESLGERVTLDDATTALPASAPSRSRLRL